VFISPFTGTDVNVKQTKEYSLPLGVVIRRVPGVTKWAKHAWKAVAVLPGAPPADWKELRREGEAVEYHAGTVSMTLHHTDTEAYRVALANEPASVYVVLRAAEKGDMPYDILTVTASAYEAQDYMDTGEEVVEPVPMPPALARLVHDFCDAHHVEVAFKKRKRRNWSDNAADDGIGDARIKQTADVYRAPGSLKKRTVH